MLRANRAFRPSSSTSHPMTSSESGQVYSPEGPKPGPVPVVDRMAPAAPSPKSAVATMLLLDKSFFRNVNPQSSATRKRTFDLGIDCAHCAARDRPITPPAHPSPNIGSL